MVDWVSSVRLCAITCSYVRTVMGRMELLWAALSAAFALLA